MGERIPTTCCAPRIRQMECIFGVALIIRMVTNAEILLVLTDGVTRILDMQIGPPAAAE